MDAHWNRNPKNGSRTKKRLQWEINRALSHRMDAEIRRSKIRLGISWLTKLKQAEDLNLQRIDKNQIDSQLKLDAESNNLVSMFI